MPDPTYMKRLIDFKPCPSEWLVPFSESLRRWENIQRVRNLLSDRIKVFNFGVSCCLLCRCICPWWYKQGMKRLLLFFMKKLSFCGSVTALNASRHGMHMTDWSIFEAWVHVWLSVIATLFFMLFLQVFIQQTMPLSRLGCFRCTAEKEKRHLNSALDVFKCYNATKVCMYWRHEKVEINPRILFYSRMQFVLT